MFTITWSCRKNRSWDNWSQWKRMATYWRLILAYNDHLCAKVQVCSCKERVHCSSPQNLQLTQECANHYTNKPEIFFFTQEFKNPWKWETIYWENKITIKNYWQKQKQQKNVGCIIFLVKKGGGCINLTIYLHKYNPPKFIQNVNVSCNKTTDYTRPTQLPRLTATEIKFKNNQTRRLKDWIIVSLANVKKNIQRLYFFIHSLLIFHTAKPDKINAFFLLKTCSLTSSFCMKNYVCTSQ